MSDTIHQWHNLVQTKALDKICTILADDVVMHSPVVHTSVQGKKMVTFILKNTIAHRYFLKLLCICKLLNLHIQYDAQTYLQRLTEAARAGRQNTVKSETIFIYFLTSFFANESSTNR
jgi:ketosteroid isomerase-like protein